MKVTIEHVENQTGLYLRYPRQSQIQPCYMYLNTETGALWCSVSEDIGNTTVPYNVWKGVTKAWKIPCLSAKGATYLMQEIESEAQRILDAVAYLENYDEADAEELRSREDIQDIIVDAEYNIEQVCYDMNNDPSLLVSEWDATDFFEPYVCVLGVTSDMTDAQLDAKARQLESEYDINENTGGPLVLWGLPELLKALRDSARDAAQE